MMNNIGAISRPHPAGAACCAAILLLSAAAWAGEPSIPDQVMAELRAANAARAELLREEQDWALEKARLELLRTTVHDEAERLGNEAEGARIEAAQLRAKAGILRAAQQKLELAEAMIDALAERLEQALDVLAGKSLPGLVPPDTAAGITDPGKRLAAGVQRLHMAEQQARKTGIELVTGNLGGRQLTVKLLRIGGTAAWWIALDGSQAGTASVRDGKLVLSTAQTPRDLEAIRKAFAVAEGRRAPDWALLPMGGIEVKQQEGRR